LLHVHLNLLNKWFILLNASSNIKQF
jgi:hypothetical protein